VNEKSDETPFIEELDASVVVPAHPEDAHQATGSAVPIPGVPDEPLDKNARFEAEILHLQQRLDESDAAYLRLRQKTTLTAMGLAALFVVACSFMAFQLKHGVTTSPGNAKAAPETLVGSNVLSDLNILRHEVETLRAETTTSGNLVSERTFRGAQIIFAHWQQGQQPIRLIKRDEGVCFLTGVSGHFAGGAESVKLWIDHDGYWYLGGDSKQQDVNADCVVLKY
jgi:hypothetical protein